MEQLWDSRKKDKHVVRSIIQQLIGDTNEVINEVVEEFMEECISGEHLVERLEELRIYRNALFTVRECLDEEIKHLTTHENA